MKKSWKKYMIQLNGARSKTSSAKKRAPFTNLMFHRNIQIEMPPGPLTNNSFLEA